jgi:predicted enzyme related to lactoylglutathione lyase
MKVQSLTPILNVSSLEESFAWFATVGWRKLWDWGHSPVFGAVASEKTEIFLCQGCQGSRGAAMPRHDFDEDTGGVWMSLFLSSPAEVDALYALALEHGVMVTCPPTDMPWGVRECHIRHPDGHTFRVGAGREEE